MYNLSNHAVRQTKMRGFNPLSILDKINKVSDQLSTIDTHQVYVICKRYNHKLKRKGCEGDTLVACVDLYTKLIVTVMLQRKEQVENHIKNNKIYLEV